MFRASWFEVVDRWCAAILWYLGIKVLKASWCRGLGNAVVGLGFLRFHDPSCSRWELSRGSKAQRAKSGILQGTSVS